VPVTKEELFALWRAIGEVGTDPAIGLKLGTETKTERFHPSGIAALSTRTFTCPEEMLHETNNEEWRFSTIYSAP
jgi:hypothetical protein